MTTPSLNRPKARPQIFFTDNYTQCYEKVQEFLDYLLETNNQRIDYGVQIKLERVQVKLKKAKTEELPPYLLQLLLRSGHHTAEKLMNELDEIARTHVDLKDEGAAAAQDLRIALGLARALSKKPAYVFESVDDMLDCQSSVDHPAPADLSNIIWVDTLNEVTQGGFGTILIGEGHHLGKVAVKRQKDIDDERSLRQFQREARIWHQLKHPNILHFMGVCGIDQVFHIVSPYMSNGNLREFVLNRPDVDRTVLLYEVACALKYIHDNHIIHGDIKASNILVSDTEHAVLCDFGLTRPEGEDTTSRSHLAGSIQWFSPEHWESGTKSPASDIYAFGITISEIVSGQTPYGDQRRVAICHRVVKMDMRPATEPKMSPSGISYQPLWDLAEKCWHKLPEERPLAGALVTDLSNQLGT